MKILDKIKGRPSVDSIQTAGDAGRRTEAQPAEPVEVAAGDLAEVPVCGWEHYLEATEALDLGSSAGLDPKAILQGLGMSLSDYVRAGTYWGEWFTQNALRDPSILARHIELSEKYRAKYAAIESDQDALV